MNDFENKIMNEYVKNHALDLMRKSADTVAKSSNVADVQQQEHEMAIASMYRVIYLALKEYHNALSRHLLKYKISLPDLDSLVSDLSKNQD